MQRSHAGLSLSAIHSILKFTQKLSRLRLELKQKKLLHWNKTEEEQDTRKYSRRGTRSKKALCWIYLAIDTVGAIGNFKSKEETNTRGPRGFIRTIRQNSTIIFNERTTIIHSAIRCSHYIIHNINEIHVNVQKVAPKPYYRNSFSAAYRFPIDASPRK